MDACMYVSELNPNNTLNQARDQEAVEDCTVALKLRPDYLKVRRTIESMSMHLPGMMRSAHRFVLRTMNQLGADAASAGRGAS